MAIRSVEYVAGTVEVVNSAQRVMPLGDYEVEGTSLVSLVSPGTELSTLDGEYGDDRRKLGYAVVFRIDAVGARVTAVKPGATVIALGSHASFQRFPEDEVVAVPDGLDPEVAVFARLMAVGWTTLVTTAARPWERVLVTGLGVIGNLTAQIFAAAGYRVTAVDPVLERRALLQGMTDAVGVREAVADTAAALSNRQAIRYHPGDFALAIDCSGHEAAVLDAAGALIAGNELVLLGVPWKARTEIIAHRLLEIVFHRYLHIRSGWEWELPKHPERFRRGSTYESLKACLAWLADGKVTVEGLAERFDPEDAADAYRSLRAGPASSLTALFDWRATSGAARAK